MAAHPRLQTLSKSPLQDRFVYHRDGIVIQLPSGGCNFRDLKTGGNAVTCGCRRFWDQASKGLSGLPHGRSGFCMCEHHACYHEQTSDTSQLIGSDLSSVVIQPGLSLYPGTPQKPVHSGHGSFHDYNPESGERHSSLPDTLQYGRSSQNGSSLGLPAIPSQCLLPSDNGSSTSSVQARHSRPFGGLGLGTLSHIPMPESCNATKLVTHDLDRKKHIYRDGNGIEYLQSLTEVATPSAHTSQEPSDSIYGENLAAIQRGLQKLVEEDSRVPNVLIRGPVSNTQSAKRHRQSPSHPAVNIGQIASEADEDDHLLPRLRGLVNHLKDYPNKVQNHEHRIVLLENTSFINPAIDDLQDADDRIETRVGDIEERLIELEKSQAALNDISSIDSKQLNGTSFGSRSSLTSSATIDSALSRMLPCRINALESQVAELQAAALPSYSRPWEVEVVFVPFGARLLGIWSALDAETQRSRFNSTGTSTSTQHKSLPLAVPFDAHNHAGSWKRSFACSEQEDVCWSVARACGKDSRIDQRLRSRGLVKTIRILGPDGRDVQAAMAAAFGDLPMILKQDPYSVRDENAGAIPGQMKNYLGLQSPWIPLRKVHKDSCLRFLDPSEMVTPALWTVPFLTSSVAMKKKNIKRLYVTQSDSYVQHFGPGTATWTWQKLRQLPRVYPDQNDDQIPEADAHEPCWNFDGRLDPAQESQHSSFASNISSLSIQSPILGNDDIAPTSQSDHFSSAPLSPGISAASVTPTNPLPSTPIKERNPFRPIHTRTLSMSSIPAGASRPFKRRITSFEQETRWPTSRSPSTSRTILKRRRVSRSPSRPRDTPRYSNGPPSPYNYMDDTAGKRDEVSTPFAYATPHSNAPYVDQARDRSGISIYEDGDNDSAIKDSNAEAQAFSDSDGQDNSNDARFEGQWQSFDGFVGYEARPAGLLESDDHTSEVSSVGVPSEYPSTQPPERSPFLPGIKTEFRIHVDEEMDQTK